ncbi:MAG: MAPEG family protein [Candidatus Binataceae bacterium]
MSSDPPETAAHPAPEKAARKHLIARSIWFTVPGTMAVIGVAYKLVPPLGGFEEPIARLTLATRWLVVAMIPYAAVCLAILGVRFFDGSHDPTRGAESDHLKIHCRVMQNTLEQFVWFAVCILAIAPMLAPAEAHLIPIVCVFFLLARLAYWWGYFRIGTLGRSPGVQLTFTLNILLLFLALARLVRTL